MSFRYVDDNRVIVLNHLDNKHVWKTSRLCGISTWVGESEEDFTDSSVLKGVSL